MGVLFQLCILYRVSKKHLDRYQQCLNLSKFEFLRQLKKQFNSSFPQSRTLVFAEALLTVTIGAQGDRAKRKIQVKRKHKSIA